MAATLHSLDDASWLRTPYRWFLEPDGRIVDARHRRSAQFLSALLLFLIVAFGILDISYAISDAAYHPPLYGYALLLIAYVLSRTRWFLLAATVSTLMFPAVVVTLTLTGASGHPIDTLNLLLVGVLFASLFFPRGGTLLAALLSLAALAVIMWVEPAGVSRHEVMRGPFLLLSVGTVITLLSMTLRSVIERDRQNDLRSATSRLEIAMQVGSVGTWDWDLRIGRVTWSGTCAELFGMPLAELGSTYDEFLGRVHPDDRAEVDASVRRLLTRDEDLRPVEFRVVRPDGSVRWVASIGAAVRDERGAAERIIGTITDITERIQNEQALQRQVLELRALSSIGLICTQTASLDELLSQVTEVVGSTFYPDHFGILLTDPDSKTLRIHPSYRRTHDAGTVNEIPLGSGISGTAALTGRSRRVADVTLEPDYIALSEGMRSEIVVPIPAGERILGVINAESHRPSAFTEADERLLTTIATEISIAMLRIQAEQELKEKEDLLVRSQALAHLGSWEWDLPTNRTRISEELSKILGVSPDPAHPLSLSLVAPEDRQLVETIVRSALQTQVIPQTEFQIVRNDGRRRTVVGQGVVVTDAKGFPVKLAGTALDITELRQAEDKFTKAFRTLQDAMIISRMPGGELVEVNEGFIKMSGFTRTEALGRTLRHLGMWDRAEDEQRIRTALQTEGSVRNYSASLIDKQRQSHACLISGEIIEVDGERLAVTITRDVTDRKILEERLLQSQKLESIGRLAGGIAHDFNNYLSAIMGYAEMAEKRLEGDEKIRGYLRNVREASERAAHLTRQLLAFARKQIIEPKVVSLNTIINASDKMLRRVIGEDVEFSFLPAPQLPAVLIDPNQFDQVLMNLVVNARDAMPSGGRIRITTSPVVVGPDNPRRRPDARTDRYVCMTVTDTGSGITEEVRQHIFEPFFTTKEQGKGTGLGLSTCLGIVDQNNGMIWVDSAPGRGSAFHVLLPAIMTDETDAGPDRDQSVPRGSETLLFVEDEDMVRQIGVDTLREAGYTVHAAANGPDALIFLSTHRGNLDMLVTDVVMPRMSGRELADRVRRQRPHIKVLYTSGYTDAIISEHGILDAGITLLQKPYAPATLAQRIRAILDGLTSD